MLGSYNRYQRIKATAWFCTFQERFEVHFALKVGLPNNFSFIHSNIQQFVGGHKAWSVFLAGNVYIKSSIKNGNYEPTNVGFHNGLLDQCREVKFGKVFFNTGDLFYLRLEKKFSLTSTFVDAVKFPNNKDIPRKCFCLRYF